MCGYCIESSVMLGYVESEQITLKPKWMLIYLQESTDWHLMLKKTIVFDQFTDAIDIAFCRMLQQYIEDGFDGSYQTIETQFDQGSISKLLIENFHHQENSLWKTLGDPSCYKSKSNWDRFIGNRHELTEASEILLRSYYDYWLVDKGDVSEKPNSNVAYIRKKYEIKSPPVKDAKKFKALFPKLFFALSFLSEYKPNSNSLIRIALSDPDAPDFYGRELWLQRKAFMACLKNYGFEFITYHFKNIRPELMAYALFKGGIDYDSLAKLTSLLNTHNQDGIISIRTSDLSDMIERYKMRRSNE